MAPSFQEEGGRRGGNRRWCLADRLTNRLVVGRRTRQGEPKAGVAFINVSSPSFLLLALTRLEPASPSLSLRSL